MSIAPLSTFCKELAMDSLKDNPFELHYSIAFPEKMGFKDLSTNLIPFQPDFYIEETAKWNSYRKTLSQMPKTHLRPKDMFLYNILYRHMDLQLESLKYPYYENPISCSGGVHSQLPILLSEYAFRSKDDIENYFSLLLQIPDYFNGLETYLTCKEINGLLIYDKFLQEAAAQCIQLFPEDQLNGQTHFLQTGFSDRIQELVAQSIISSEEADQYILRNNTLLKTKLSPAYQNFSTFISSLKGTSTLSGLSAYPHGKEYYTLLLRAGTGSDKTPENILDILYKRYDMLYASYSQLLQESNPSSHRDFPFQKSSDMLQNLFETSQTYFPALDTVTDYTKQQVHLKKVDGILKNMSAPAFYMTPPIDANSEHTIYVNPTLDTSPLETYTTLAHEGFPGHLYQTVYSQNALTNAHEPLIRQLLYFGGYTEGWAVYAEFYSYNFISAECDSTQRSSIELARLNREIQLCLCSILDIYIHYEGASVEKIENLLTSLGLNSSAAEVIYETICDAPANYPKYYLGYLEILDLQNIAKSLWANDYSDYAFHKWLLEIGPADFESLRSKLNHSE